MTEPTIGKKIGCLLVLIIAGGLGIISLFFCTTKIPANRFGVRTTLTPGGGLEAKDYPPGFVWSVPGLHRVTTWDTTWSNLKVTLQIRGSDQYTTQVDVSILWRVALGKCNEAARIFRDEEHAGQIVAQTLNKYANEILATLKTEDFYDSDKRIKASEETEKAMEEQIKPVGLEITNLLLRNIVYDPKFEAQLLAKQLAGQQKALSQSKGLMASSQTKTQLIQKDAANQVLTLTAEKEQEIQNMTASNAKEINNIAQDAQKKAAEMTSKAKASRRQKEAEATFLKASAQATGMLLLSKAYSQPGATTYFATKSIEGMKLDTVEVNSSVFNPLEVKKMVESLGK